MDRKTKRKETGGRNWEEKVKKRLFPILHLHAYYYFHVPEPQENSNKVRICWVFFKMVKSRALACTQNLSWKQAITKKRTHTVFNNYCHFQSGFKINTNPMWQHHRRSYISAACNKTCQLTDWTKHFWCYLGLVFSASLFILRHLAVCCLSACTAASATSLKICALSPLTASPHNSWTDWLDQKQTA